MVWIPCIRIIVNVNFDTFSIGKKQPYVAFDIMGIKLEKGIKIIDIKDLDN